MLHPSKSVTPLVKTTKGVGFLMLAAETSSKAFRLSVDSLLL